MALFERKTFSQMLAATAMAVALVSYAPSSEAQFHCRAALSHNSLHDSRPWFEQVSFSQIERVLAGSEIVKIEDFRALREAQSKRLISVSERILLLTFADGTQGIWKPGSSSAIAAEVAAFRAARKIGSRLVPPTVERALPSGVTGSVQYFVRSTYDLVNMTYRERSALWGRVPKEQKSERDAFNFVFGQWDLHSGNVLIDQNFNLVSIDNGGIRNRQMVRFGDLPFVKRFNLKRQIQRKLETEAFPFDSAVFLKKPSADEILDVLRPYVEEKDRAFFIDKRRPSKQNPDPDNTMKIAIWGNSIWIQTIGFANYGPLKPESLSERTLAAYRALTFGRLRILFPESAFSSAQLHEILERRDQLLNAVEQGNIGRH